MNLKEILTDAYARTWTSADVREGNCNLDLCHQPIRRRPDGKLVSSSFEATANTAVAYHDPTTILNTIFGDDSWYAGLFIHNSPREGKVDGGNAQILWAEWQKRTRLFGHSYAHAFLKEIGLPVVGGLLVKGELDTELVAGSAISEEYYKAALLSRAFYIHAESTEEIRGIFVTCHECHFATVKTSYVHGHSPWTIAAGNLDKGLEEVFSNIFVKNYTRRADWDCPHVKEVLQRIASIGEANS